MNRLRFEYDWEDSRGRGEPEFRVTMASLRIAIGGETVTDCILGDRTSPAIRTPLYPVAEWIVSQWFPLLHETRNAKRAETLQTFPSRHCLLSAREGFALPDLQFLPEGDDLRLVWNRHRMTHQQLEFSRSGETVLERNEVEQSLETLVGAVLERLLQKGVSGTWLQGEWEAIQNLSPDERDFCVAVSRLGADPFDIADSEADELVACRNRLPSDILDDFLSALPLPQLATGAQWMMDNLHFPRPLKAAGKWEDVKRASKDLAAIHSPWQRGYEAAQRIRSQGIGPDEVEDSIDADPFESKPPSPSIRGVSADAEGYLPVCRFERGIAANDRFLKARTFGDYLAGRKHSLMLSEIPTPSQQYSRAFAAEFLAPSQDIRRLLTRSDVSEEELDEIAADFQVSTWVIRHQIQNHRLAKISM